MFAQVRTSRNGQRAAVAGPDLEQGLLTERPCGLTRRSLLRQGAKVGAGALVAATSISVSVRASLASDLDGSLTASRLAVVDAPIAAMLASDLAFVSTDPAVLRERFVTSHDALDRATSLEQTELLDHLGEELDLGAAPEVLLQDLSRYFPGYRQPPDLLVDKGVRSVMNAMLWPSRRDAVEQLWLVEGWA